MRTAFSICFLFALGCSCSPTPKPLEGVTVGPDDAAVRAADVSILFIGNSHTHMHDVPGLVAKMIRHRHPEKTVHTHTLVVGFLDQVAADANFTAEAESGRWKYVVLQAQKISSSGKFQYSKQEGIDYAKLAKEHGSKVFFFSEWGLRGKAGDGESQEQIYQKMAIESGTNVARVGRAWDIALAEKADLPLYFPDGNHQSATGAFLTACTLYSELLGEDPAELANFEMADVSAEDRKLLANAASRMFKAKK